MRITYLLLFGIACCIAASTAAATTTTSTSSSAAAKSDHVKPKRAAVDAVKNSEAAAAATPKETTSKSEKTTSGGREAKSLGDNRGKRTLYDFGNAGYLYSEVASRRAGFGDGSEASYYPQQSGYFNGQSAIAQYPGYVPAYASYPQYLEAPEPIIEIIIKDANETLAEEPAQPIVTKKKKKKEKVHVFYVNYKKDQNNKLHLETPIASLNNDDNDDEEEEEEEEVIQYPVTPLPPVKTTTLRTIIHPDSEKYHSNSGIHVSFGAEDKHQLGHILEEHDAESIQRQVVALPVGSGVKSDNFLAGTRADYGRDNGFERSANSNLLFGNNANAYHQQSTSSSSSSLFQSQQQLPVQQTNNYFRAPASTQSTQVHKPAPPQQQQQQHQQQQQQQQHYYNKQQHQHHQQQQQHHQQQQHQQQQQQHHHHQQQQQQHHQQQPQQQRQSYAPPSPTHSIFSKLLQQSQYYVNHNQQYQHQQHSSQQQQQQQQHQQQYYKPNTQAVKQAPFFPTIPPKTQTPAAYQPVKFRPTAAPVAHIKPAPIPAKLDSTNYQQQQQQQHYQAQSHQQHQHQQHKQQQHQQQQQSLPFQFNRQPQFVQQPVFTVQSPTPQLQDYYQSQQKTQLNKYQTQSQSQRQSQSQTASTALNPTTSLSAVHNLFDIQPSKETELLKAIPKFEQHITETVQSPIGHQQFSFSGTRNQVIHDIPAPNLGPTLRPQIQLQQQQEPSQQQLGGHYITAASQQQQQQQQQQYTNFVTTSQTVGNAFLSHQQQQQPQPSSTASPVFAESTHGQKVMVVTPMPATAYTQYQYSSNNEAVIQVPAQTSALQAQASTNFAQQPRQSASSAQIAAAQANENSPFSVSTYHQDVFKELQQRTQQQTQQQQQQQVAQQQQQQQQQPQQQQQEQPSPAVEKGYIPSDATKTETSAPTTAAPAPNGKASQTLLQLPDEVPDDLRQQLFSSGILNNADISVLDYDKVGDIALENLPAEHLQHFYGAGGGAQIAETKKVLTVLKPNGDKVALSEKDIKRVKATNSLPQKQGVDVKVVRFDAQQEKNISEKYLKSDATVVPPVDLADRQYNRYLPLKVNGAQFPIPDSEELQGKRVVSVVVLAPVEASALQAGGESEARGIDTKEVKFLGGDLIKTLVKKPTKENFKRWLEKESRTDLELQSVVLLVAKSSDKDDQEIYMYDISSGAVNRLNGELSSTFVSVAEENASSEDLEHAATLDPSTLEAMMHTRR